MSIKLASLVLQHLLALNQIVVVPLDREKLCRIRAIIYECILAETDKLIENPSFPQPLLKLPRDEILDS